MTQKKEKLYPIKDIIEFIKTDKNVMKISITINKKVIKYLELTNKKEISLVSLNEMNYLIDQHNVGYKNLVYEEDIFTDFRLIINSISFLEFDMLRNEAESKYTDNNLNSFSLHFCIAYYKSHFNNLMLLINYHFTKK